MAAIGALIHLIEAFSTGRVHANSADLEHGPSGLADNKRAKGRGVYRWPRVNANRSESLMRAASVAHPNLVVAEF